MTMVEQLYEVGGKLPAPALAKLLDFAEFLRQKSLPPQSGRRVSLAELGGGLEDSATFAGSPLELQEKMRREWDWLPAGYKLYSWFTQVESRHTCADQ